MASLSACPKSHTSTVCYCYYTTKWRPMIVKWKILPVEALNNKIEHLVLNLRFNTQK